MGCLVNCHRNRRSRLFFVQTDRTRAVFNIKGNSYRLVCEINYPATVVEIRNGTKGFTLPQIRRLHQAYHIPADALIAEPA